MFSENEIVVQCSQCSGPCDDIKQCPLKIKWPNVRESKIFPVIVTWKLSGPDKCVYMPAGDRYSTEKLITGLNKLGSHL
jgi:hypothetical protein